MEKNLTLLKIPKCFTMYSLIKAEGKQNNRGTEKRLHKISQHSTVMFELIY